MTNATLKEGKWWLSSFLIVYCNSQGLLIESKHLLHKERHFKMDDETFRALLAKTFQSNVYDEVINMGFP